MRASPRGRRSGPRLLLSVGLLVAALHVAQAEEGPGGGHPLVGTAWRAEILDDAPTRDHEASTLAFPTAHRVVGGAACNRFHGRVALAGEEVAIGPLAVTERMCAPPVMGQERRYLAALAATRRAVLRDDALVLHDAEGRVRARLRRIGVPSAPLAVGEGAGAPGSRGQGKTGTAAP